MKARFSQIDISVESAKSIDVVESGMTIRGSTDLSSNTSRAVLKFFF
jgi:hypothetical protein